MTEVYKTNVPNRQQANRIIALLEHSFLGASVNFDLQDCDKVLRVEGIAPTDADRVIQHLIRFGYACEILN